MKLDLLTNATVVDDAIRFVSQESRSRIEPSNKDSADDKQKSKETDYDQDKDQLEEEQEEETKMTTNHVF